MSAAPQVDFYLLSQSDAATKLHYTCRLVQKAFVSKLFCYVLANDRQQLQALDDLLWEFNPVAFIPHRSYEPGLHGWHNYPVQIGLEDRPDQSISVLLNLKADAEQINTQRARILEVVANDEKEKRAARARFKYYREKGIEPNTHKL